MPKKKEQVKGLLRAVGLYEPAHNLWNGRADTRTSCRNAGYRLAGSADGLPIPPTQLIYLVANSKEVSWFLHSGMVDSDSVLSTLAQNGYQMEDFESILDFGCGCGRLMRYWKSIRGPHFYGSDYNPQLVNWCRKYLGHFAEFNLNNLEPGLAFRDGRFDFIYTISVFTHLTEALQLAWINELARVMKPSGILLLTVHGKSRLPQLDPENQRLFRSGQMVVTYDDVVGTNWCAAYHPEGYVRNTLAKSFDVLDYLPSGARSADQDIYLLRKKAAR